MNDCEMIHETFLRDIVDIMQTAKDVKNDKLDNVIQDRRNVGSIAKRASKLVLVFPVIVSNDLTYSTASLITKALERKCVSLLQILFSSITISNSDNLQDYIRKFHRNLNGKIDLDTFIGDMDSLVNHEAVQVINKEQYDAVMADLKNINFTLSEEYNPISINAYREVSSNYGERHVVLTESIFKKDDKDNNKPTTYTPTPTNPVEADPRTKAEFPSLEDSDATKVTGSEEPVETTVSGHEKIDEKLAGMYGSAYSDLSDFVRMTIVDKIVDKYGKDGAIAADQFDANALGRDVGDYMNYYNKQVITQKDAYKNNELEPTMMIVNFNAADPSLRNNDGSKVVVHRTAVLGVKCKMYPVNSMELITRISSKYSDSHGLFKLIRAGTREISFLRDLVFAIDNTKSEAIATKKDSNNARMFRILERRARGAHNKLLRNNDASPITTMVLSKNEVEYLRKYCGLDITKQSVARVILDKYNLLGLAIADEALEIASFLFDDGDSNFETLTFDSLAKEQKDSSYKKIVNLMSKIAR